MSCSSYRNCARRSDARLNSVSFRHLAASSWSVPMCDLPSSGIEAQNGKLHNAYCHHSFLTWISIFQGGSGKQSCAQPEFVRVVVAVLHDDLCHLAWGDFLGRTKPGLLFLP